ncbi:MAG: hypothetical protein K6G73_12960 [Marinilabiliaceae bacterium]|nr:hypothetical protein [Marinilabiliaceae bacterium]
MNKLILVIFVAMTISCCRIDDNIIGKYNSYRHEKGVIHYVELFPDSTYEHVYVQNGEKMVNKGGWTIYRKDCSIFFVNFYNWENFGYAKDYCKKHIFQIDGYDVFIKNKKCFFM